jgi:AraC-like DNA-binding protein
MAAVVRSPSAGATLTEAALDAGFAGSSHLSAAFRAAFGIKPSSLLTPGPEIAAPDDRDPRADPMAQAAEQGPRGGFRTRP